MKTITTWILAAAIAITSLSCTTTYDAYGNPRQSVDPGTAAAGVAAAGVLGYALAKDNKKNKSRHYHYDDRRSHGYHDRYGRYHRY